jgi:Cu(I)/Ag(I) efflux system membrane fusion protein
MKTLKRVRVKPISRRAKTIVLASLALSVLVFFGLRASESKPAEAAPEEAAVTVVDKTTLQLSDSAAADLETAKAATQNFAETLPMTGSISVVENHVSVVSSRVTGRVDSVLKVTGETVKAGEPLALIYSPDYLSAREEYLQVQKENIQPGSDLAGFADLARKKLETMGLSADDIAHLADAGTDDHLVVRAAKDGVLTSVNTVVGNMQNPGDTLFTTANLDRVWFAGDLYIEDLPKAHNGQKILIKAEGQDEPLTGTLSFISPVVDANARTVKVRAIIDNPNHVLRAAMFVQGSLVLNDQPALVVPEAAVLTLNDKTYCFKEVGKNRFAEVPVTVGRQDDDLASISTGLSSGDEVVAKDLATLDRALDEGRAND